MATDIELYACEDLPIFQNRVYATEAEARLCQRADLRLVQSLETGLIYNSAFRPELVVYDSGYQNEQATSPAFRNHLGDVAGLIERTMGRDQLIEVGCGKGFFLEAMRSRGADISGFDPAYEGNSPYIAKQLFQRDAGMEAKGLVLRHVLEHIQHPVEFLRNLASANGGGGLIYIEVPCFDWIAGHRAWFDIFYEHVNYFRLGDFARIFGHVVESGRIFGGQYLYVVADLASIQTPKFRQSDRCEFPADFLASMKPLAASPAAIWGAASKGVIFSLMMERLGEPISTAIDINPVKQGKFLPATGIQVRSPAEALSSLPEGSAIYVMNSNYLDEIRRMSNNAYRYVSIENG